ncbi:MAG TPA: histidine phosphatase family protein [Salinarimonas sp.]|nr:histidine phosphatase family protein [Salinarimonas sp.]
MTLVVHLVRHAAHGLLGRTLTGRMPGVSLSPEGRAQGKRLAARLGGMPVDAVETSPLERARETAQPIADALGLTPVVAPALSEIEFGTWTGMSFDALADDPAWRRWNAARSLGQPPGGESMLAVQERMRAHLEALRRERPEGRVVLVSHCDVIRAALLHVLGLSLDLYDRIAVDPASVSTLALGDWGARVLSVNEACP